MYEFSDLDDAKRIVRAARESYESAPGNPPRVTHALLGDERVQVTCWQQTGKANYGLDPGWRFTGSWEELRSWWEQERPDAEEPRDCPTPREKDEGLWEMNLRYRVPGGKEFDFHLTLGRTGRANVGCPPRIIPRRSRTAPPTPRPSRRCRCDAAP